MRAPVEFRAARTALLLAALLLPVAPPGGAVPAAEASIPSGDPAFSTSLVVANPWFPVRPGNIKVYRGRERRLDITVVESHLEEVRTFDWRGLPVDCRTVRESLFVDGALLETSRSWYAQSDDGSVWTFGEVNEPGDDEDAPGEGDEDDRSWVVGAVLPADPPDTVAVADPALFLPAFPDPGDTWSPEAVDPATDEVDTVRRIGARVRVPAGLYLGCLEILEESGSGRGREIKWYAPGVGVVGTRGGGERVRLQATTLGRPSRPPRRP